MFDVRDLNIGYRTLNNQHRRNTNAPAEGRCYPVVRESKEFSGRFDVFRDSLFQIIDGRELLFIADFVHEREFHFLAINIVGKIQQMRLDVDLRARAVESRALSDVDRSAVNLSRDLRVGGVNTVG